jgi:hypothetical protein
VVFKGRLKWILKPVSDFGLVAGVKHPWGNRGLTLLTDPFVRVFS